MNLALVWWLCLGIPLSWKKGSRTHASSEYTWIGVSFKQLAPNVASMTLPAKFIEELQVIICRFLHDKGFVPSGVAKTFCWKIGVWLRSCLPQGPMHRLCMAPCKELYKQLKQDQERHLRGKWLVNASIRRRLGFSC